MQVAQQLYEGLDVGDEGTVGLITYMRTDATRVSNEALSAVRKLIEGEYGKDYVPAKPRTFTAKKGAQEAHEAIRPTAVERTPAYVQKYLSRDQFRLYKLIWERFVASQMASAVLDVVAVTFAVGEYEFRLTAPLSSSQDSLSYMRKAKTMGRTGNRECPPCKKGNRLHWWI